jgi:sigma-E factor negative regulatory protein RseC
MMLQRGKVVAIEKGWAWIETFQASACQSCALKSGCGQRMMANVLGERRRQLKVSLHGLDFSVQSGNVVELQLPEHTLLAAVAWMYGLPLLLLMGGALAGFKFGSGADSYAVLGGVSGLLVAVMILRWHASRHGGGSNYQPVIHRVCVPEQANTVIASDCPL